MIGARLEEGYKRNFGSPVILEGSKQLQRDEEICIACSLVVPNGGQAPIRVANFLDKPQTLRSDISFAEYQPIALAVSSLLTLKQLCQAYLAHPVRPLTRHWGVLVLKRPLFIELHSYFP